MKKSLRRLRDLAPGQALSPQQFDEAMAPYAGTQPSQEKPAPVTMPLRSPGSLERKRT